MRVLLAYDGSTHADVALDGLAMCGLGDAPDVVVVSVADVFDESSAGSVRGFDGASGVLRTFRTHSVDELEQARRTAEAGADRVRALLPQARVTADACAGSPAWEVIQKAEEMHADLIVIGTHGRSAVGRLLLGSVSTRVVEQASCSVRIVRAMAHRPPGPPRVLVGYDGSKDADAVLTSVEARCWPAGTEIRLACAVDPVVLTAFGWLIPPLVKWADEVNTDGLNSMQKMLDAIALRMQSLNVTTRVREGRPKEVLAHAADEWHADVILVGARGLRGIERMLLGSVSHALATLAHCSVEVVRGGAVATGAPPAQQVSGSTVG